MIARSMDIVSRHKKPGAFIKLVQSLETTPPIKRQEILKAIREQDADLAEDAERCLFSFEEFFQMDDKKFEKVLSEVLDPKVIAFAIFKTPTEWQEKVTKNLNPRMQYPLRDEFEKMTAITQGEQQTAQYKIIQKARKLQDAGLLMLKPYLSKYPSY